MSVRQEVVDTRHTLHNVVDRTRQFPKAKPAAYSVEFTYEKVSP